MSDVYFIVIPVVIVVVILKICLICWRIWLYQRKRERVLIVNQARHVSSTTRIVGVERVLGPEGYTQRTAYVINENGSSPRQVTRTVTIRPRESEHPHDPNMPPTYDQAVTGKDKSVTVNAQGSSANTNPLKESNPVQAPPDHDTSTQGNSVQLLPSTPCYDVVPPLSPSAPMPNDLAPPPAYSPLSHSRSSAPVIRSPDRNSSSSSLDADDTARLLA